MRVEMLDLLIFILVVISIGFLSIENIRLKNKVNELNFSLIQSYLDIEAIKKINNKKEQIEKDHLIAFLDDSRDSAYSYISEAQEKINIFINELESDVNYFNSFENIAKQDMHYELIKKFIKHYNSLKDLLPKDDKR
jgi:chloramphenicol O-acetyltransferase